MFLNFYRIDSTRYWAVGFSKFNTFCWYFAGTFCKKLVSDALVEAAWSLRRVRCVSLLQLCLAAAAVTASLDKKRQ